MQDPPCFHATLKIVTVKRLVSLQCTHKSNEVEKYKLNWFLDSLWKMLALNTVLKYANISFMRSRQRIINKQAWVNPSSQNIFTHGIFTPSLHQTSTSLCFIERVKFELFKMYKLKGVKLEYFLPLKFYSSQAQVFFNQKLSFE